MTAQNFSFVRKKLAKHDADLLLPMPLCSEFMVLVPQLLTSRSPMSFPVTARSSLMPPTRQSERGANSQGAQFRNFVEKAKGH